ncbi:hypothetical protein EYF80_004138 [Liparis tanakae]|uniref:Uncharacterized protein n=1 Tax=Liparis tanakae TaxID=230148 RepID=A0A4Z2J549_9TELE|nr:hypothetical protein EYF80_004138 [Liparis tanakae]
MGELDNVMETVIEKSEISTFSVGNSVGAKRMWVGIDVRLFRILNPQLQGNGGFLSIIVFIELHPHACILCKEGMIQEVLDGVPGGNRVKSHNDNPVGPVMKMLSHLRSLWMIGGVLVWRKWRPLRICLHQLRRTFGFITLKRLRYLRENEDVPVITSSMSNLRKRPPGEVDTAFIPGSSSFSSLPALPVTSEGVTSTFGSASLLCPFASSAHALSMALSFSITWFCVLEVSWRPRPFPVATRVRLRSTTVRRSKWGPGPLLTHSTGRC